jgi:hypothetical protein
MVTRTGEDYHVAMDRVIKATSSRPIPGRDVQAGTDQIDLSDIYNAALNEAWQPMDSLEALGQDLLAFPAGLTRCEGTLFDVRGVVQLCSSHPDWCSFPEGVEIPVRRRFQRFHVLHGVALVERDGTVIGVYRLTYTDGREHEIEIQYGRDLRDWWVSRDPKPTTERSEMAWTAPRLSASSETETVRLFSTTYTNPRPEMEVVRVHFESKATQSAPFLLAMTIE